MKLALAALAALTLASAAVAGPPPAANAEKATAMATADGVVDKVVDQLWQGADRYWHDGDYNRILGLGRICIEADPGFDDAYDSCAWLLWSMGEVPAADWLLEYGVKRSPQKGIFYNNIGQHLYRTKRYAESQSYLEKAIKLREGVPPVAWSTLGHLYTRAGRLADAVTVFRDQTQRFPGFPAAAKNLKQAEERLAAPKR